MKQCMEEVQKRLVLNAPKFIVKVVDKEGTRKISLKDVVIGEGDISAREDVMKD